MVTATAARKSSINLHGGGAEQKRSEEKEFSAATARKHSLVLHGDNGGQKLSKDTELSAAAARKHSLILHGNGTGGHKLQEESLLANPAPSVLSSNLEVHDPERSLVGRDWCPGLDDAKPRGCGCEGFPEACFFTQISCFSYLTGQCYCYEVGVDTVAEATSATLDQVSPFFSLFLFFLPFSLPGVITSYCPMYGGFVSKPSCYRLCSFCCFSYLMLLFDAICYRLFV